MKKKKLHKKGKAVFLTKYLTYFQSHFCCRCCYRPYHFSIFYFGIINFPKLKAKIVSYTLFRTAVYWCTEALKGHLSLSWKSMFFLLKMGVCFQKWESENGKQGFDSRWRLSTTVVLEQWSQTVRSGRENGNCKDSCKEIDYSFK